MSDYRNSMLAAEKWKQERDAAMKDFNARAMEARAKSVLKNAFEEGYGSAVTALVQLRNGNPDLWQNLDVDSAATTLCRLAGIDMGY